VRLSILAFILLVACGRREAPPAEKQVSAPQAVTAKPAQPPAKPFELTEENDLYSFRYGWPAEAAAIPQLSEQFQEDMEKMKAELVAEAKEDRAARNSDGYEYHPHESQRNYTTAGQSERLLSLEMAGYSFTGGAHGTGYTDALLWDRAQAKELKIGQLLLPNMSWTGAIRQPFCTLLDRQREKKRGEPVRKDDMFGECPPYDDLTVLLSDLNHDGRFDHVQVIADQYVAGPYAEGPYEIALPITSKMIDRLKPEFRSSFEAQPPVQ
jgi:hypothetical protein